jgi:hypothetical protein
MLKKKSNLAHRKSQTSNGGELVDELSLEEELEKIRKVAVPPPPKSDPIYRYLRQSLRLFYKVVRSPKMQAELRVRHKAEMPRVKPQYINVIIGVTAADPDEKKRSKYADTLELAKYHSIPAKELEERILAEGGINECVNQWSEICGKHVRIFTDRRL